MQFIFPTNHYRIHENVNKQSHQSTQIFPVIKVSDVEVFLNYQIIVVLFD